MWSKLAARSGLLTIYVAALCLPVYAFFHDRGGAQFLKGASSRNDLQLLFPLLGLYAFTFVTFQVLIATNLRWLKRLWPHIIEFHRAEGGFALLFAVLHPLFILTGFGLTNYLHTRYVAADLRWWVLPGYLALTLLLLTVITASLAWYGRNLPWWRALHRLNYLVFALVWVHSWMVGTDTQTPLLKTIWLGYLGAVTVSVLVKYYTIWADRSTTRPKISHTPITLRR